MYIEYVNGIYPKTPFKKSSVRARIREHCAYSEIKLRLNYIKILNQY